MFNYLNFFLTYIMITINNINNSSDLLFSIPVHENQDIINNTIENIFNFNPNCKIILHINKNFSSFSNSKSNYSNLYFNTSMIDYTRGGDLLAYHISNFKYAMKNNIEFKYYILCASNELYIKKGAVNYINAYKNGLQIVQYNNIDNDNIDNDNDELKNNDNEWHNFKKKLDENVVISNLFDIIKNRTLCGGQAEGQFYEKDIFEIISNHYLTITNNNEIFITFETEEIIPATIFNTYSIDNKLNYGIPITLQNYSNKIHFTVNYIKKLINGINIENNLIKNSLKSPHVNLSSENIYSIKRVDRTFNKIRNYLTNNGFILNKDEYIKNTPYYSNNSSIIIRDDNNIDEIEFKKMKDGYKDFQWFGFHIQTGLYNIEFEVKTNTFINPFYNCGIKMHHPYNYIISNFLEGVTSDYKKVSIPIINNSNQDILFIFDNFLKKINIDFKNICFNKSELSNTNNTNKKNIIIVLFKNNNEMLNNYYNIQYYLIDIFKKIYNIYIISILNTNKNNEKYILENFNSNFIYYNKSIDFNTIMENISQFINEFNIHYEFIFISNLDITYLQKISNMNIIVNKINFLCYKNNIDYYDVDHNISIIPCQYFNKLYDICKNIDKNNNKNINNKNNNKNNIITKLYKNHINFHLLIDDFFYDNENILFNKQINTFSNNGFLFENNFTNNVIYHNNFCYFKKIKNNHFYFFKNVTNKYQDFLWCGYNLKFSEENNNNIDIKVTFNMKINNKFNIPKNVGLKTHYPIQFYNDFFQNITINKYTNIEFIINIQKKNQLIIFNFDNYLDEIEFEIKDFTLNYNI